MKNISMQNIEQIISDFKKQKVLVIGDLMLDQWVWGKVHRISPEAPIPIVDVERYTFTPGGAANVVTNLSELGARSSLSGIIGRDSTGKMLKRLLRDKGIFTRGIFDDEDRPTILKTRIVAHSQQLVRVDLEKKSALNDNLKNKIINFFKEEIPFHNSIIISDYNKGFIDSQIVENIVEIANKLSIKIVCGPKPENIDAFKGVYCITMNKKEAGGATGISITNNDSLCDAGRNLLKRLGSEAVIITRGEEGLSLFTKDGSVFHLEACASQVFDVSGAGDTVLSVIALCLNAGADPYYAALLANHAAAVVVRKIGTATLTNNELIETLKINLGSLVNE